MAKQLKQWQGWLLFGGSMVVVFLLGLLVSSLMERRAEVASVFNNKRTVFEDEIIAQNEKFTSSRVSSSIHFVHCTKYYVYVFFFYFFEKCGILAIEFS